MASSANDGARTIDVKKVNRSNYIFVFVLVFMLCVVSVITETHTHTENFLTGSDSHIFCVSAGKRFHFTLFQGDNM